MKPALETDDGPVLAANELAADKVLALAGRAAARDYLDFQALATRYSIDELAVSKDLGFTRTGTTTPNRCDGPKPPKKSSPKPAEPEPHSTKPATHH